MKAIVDGDIPDPRDSYPHIPETLVLALFKAVNREPDNRYQSCSDFAGALVSVGLEDVLDDSADDAPFSFIKGRVASESFTDSSRKEDNQVKTDLLKINSAGSRTQRTDISEQAKEAEIVDITSSESDMILANFIGAAWSSQQVRSVLLDARGKSGAIAGKSTLVSVDLTSGKEKTLRLPGGYVASADSINGYHAIVTGENQISLWNSLFSSELGYISSIYQKIQDVSFRSGDHLVILAGKSIIGCSLPSVWRRNPRLETIALLPDNRNNLLDVSTDGSIFALADSFGSVNIHSCRDRFKRLVHVDSGSTVKSLGFSPRGRHLAILTHEGRLMILEVDSGRLLRFPKEMAFLDIAFTEELLIGLTFNDGIYFWESGKYESYRMSVAGELLTGIYGSLRSSVFAVSVNSGEVKFFDLENITTV